MGSSPAEVNIGIHDTVWHDNIGTGDHASIWVKADRNINSADFSLTDTVVRDNDGEHTCGIYAGQFSHITFDNVQVYNNTCSSGDGYVFDLEANSTLVGTNADIYQNVAPEGTAFFSPNLDLSKIDSYNNTGNGLVLNPTTTLGSLSLKESSVVNNTGQVALGITNDAGGYSADIRNVTVAGNTSMYSAMTLTSDETNPVSGTLKNITIANNHRTGNIGADAPGAMMFLSFSELAPTATIENLLMSDNYDETTLRNCAPIAMPTMFYPISIGHNLSSDNTCTSVLDQPTDISNVSAMLDSLTNDNGTWVLPLQSNSPANDGGATVSGMTADQRGTARPQNNAFDIGAYETMLSSSSGGNNSSGSGGGSAGSSSGSGQGGSTASSGTTAAAPHTGLSAASPLLAITFLGSGLIGYLGYFGYKKLKKCRLI